MADKERDSMLREMAQHRGFKLVKSRRRKPGGDLGRYGLKTADKGEECLGFGPKGLTASADEIENFLRRQTASTWQKSLGATPKKAEPTAAKRKVKADSQSPPSPEAERKPKRASASKPAATARAPEPPKLRLRDADSADAEALAALISEFSPATAEEMGDRLPILRRAGEAPIVARLGDEVVGIVTWHITPVLHRPKPVGRITFLQVKESFRRKGIGEALVTAAVGRLEERGCGWVEVTSNVKLTRAHAFYRALGFERTSYRFGKEIAGKKGK
jgi:ribosomal protein S18 acetylase RimI-like enzyme